MSVGAKCWIVGSCVYILEQEITLLYCWLASWRRASQNAYDEYKCKAIMHTKMSSERFKSTFVNRLIFRYNLALE